MSSLALHIFRETWLVLGEMAPYLLFGFLMAGVLSVCISPKFIERHLGGRGLLPVLKGSLFGVPMPLCSCGVIPVAASFRRHGASRAATISFLISTPQTGMDNITVVYGLLGGVFAILSPIIALSMGLLGGVLVWLFGERNGQGNGSPTAELCTADCCAESKRGGIVRRVIEYGFIALPRDIGWAVLIGVAIAGSLTALVPADQWQQYLNKGFFSIIAMMALGIPIYVCASGSVPIAATLIHLGASPGAALAFLIAGPASNAATLTTIWKTLGPRTMVLYILTIAVSAVGGGMAIDWLFPTLRLSIASHVSHMHHVEAMSWTTHVWAVLLLAIIAYSYAARPRAKNDYTETDMSDDSLPAAETIALAVTGMTCDHCAASVTAALKRCDGVRSVAVDRKAGRATVVGVGLQMEQLLAAVQSAGYDAQAADA